MANLYFDLDAINNYIFGEDEERQSAVEITEVQALADNGKDLVTVNKTIREVKESNDMTNKQTIRYDLIKMFIDILNDTEGMEYSEGQKTIINTMANYGLIHNNEEDE